MISPLYLTSFNFCSASPEGDEFLESCHAMLKKDQMTKSGEKVFAVDQRRIG